VGEKSDYRGMFMFGQKHGFGKLNDKVDNSLYEGHFLNDKMNGVGTYTFSDGKTFTGIFINDVLESEH